MQDPERVCPCESFFELQMYKEELTAANEELVDTAHQLAEQTTHLRMLLRVLPDMVWVKDLEGRYTLCNRKFEDFFGVRSAELIGKTIYDIVDHAKALASDVTDKEVIATGKEVIFEAAYEDLHGDTSRIFETIKSPVYAGNRQIVGIISIARDTTWRRELEQQVQEASNMAEWAALTALISDRELEVLQGIGTGQTSKEIGATLFITQKTVEAHRYSLMKKIGVTNIAGLHHWFEVANYLPPNLKNRGFP